MKSNVPLLLSPIGINAPAHWSGMAEVRARLPVPLRVRRDRQRWLFDEGEIGWPKVCERWKRRGPANRKFVEMIQEGRGFRQQLEMAA